VELAFYLGANYVALGSLQAARRELRTVLVEAPDYELPQYTSPKVAALFREVRDDLEKAPRLRPLPPERNGDAMTLRFEASRTGGRAFGVVHFRWHGDGQWRESPMSPRADTLLEARVPVEQVGTLEYWAEGRAPQGALVAGSADRPLELPMAVGPHAPRYASTEAGDDGPRHEGGGRRRWWLWTGLGVIGAAGLGVGLYFALRPQPSSTADAVLDFQVR
jgi:hypothetical protein